MAERALIEGRPVLVVIDIQGGEGAVGAEGPAIPLMPGYDAALARAPELVAAARTHGIPVVFFQEAHRRDLVDFGRELDGVEGVHLLEGDPGTELDPRLGVGPEDYVIRKRRYSCFFGTDFEILLRGLGAETLFLIGGHTDVCVHYTFVDAHQRDYHCRVVEDCVAGSSVRAHEAALEAMAYLQSRARCTVDEVLAAFAAHAARGAPSQGVESGA
ncbi:MAG: cysteine hydrolase [Actinomyces sp.]|nr:MAG: cysteine hydrolase [Actinomyces sp.]